MRWGEIAFLWHDCPWFPKAVTKYWGSPTEQSSALCELWKNHISSPSPQRFCSPFVQQDFQEGYCGVVPWVNMSLWLWGTLNTWLTLNKPQLTKMLIWRSLWKCLGSNSQSKDKFCVKAIFNTSSNTVKVLFLYCCSIFKNIQFKWRSIFYFLLTHISNAWLCI